MHTIAFYDSIFPLVPNYHLSLLSYFVYYVINMAFNLRVFVHFKDFVNQYLF